MRIPALALLAAAACSSPERAPAPAEPAAAASSQTPWMKVRLPEGIALLEAPARVLVTPDASAVVAPPLRARIVKVLVVPGQRVAKGAPVAEVLMPELVGAAGSFLAASERLQAWQARRAQLDKLKAEGLARVTDILEADTNVAEAKAEQRLAQATLRAGGASETEAARLVSEGGASVLRAPMAGTVMSASGAAGETRDPGAEPLVRLVGEAPSRIEARFAQGLVPGAKYGFVASGGLRHELVLAGTSPDVDAADGSMRVWFKLPPNVPPLPPGLAGRVEARLGPDSTAVVVPARGLRLENGRASITVRREGKEQQVEVEVLSSSGTDALVRPREGRLTAEDEVAAEAAAGGDGA